MEQQKLTYFASTEDFNDNIDPFSSFADSAFQKSGISAESDHPSQKNRNMYKA